MTQTPQAWRRPALELLEDDDSCTRPVLPTPSPRAAAKRSHVAIRPDRLAPGQIVGGRYCIQSQVAVGGMGRIYAAEQVPLGRPVALKILDPRLTREHPDFRNRFLLEAASCARITHPNVVTVHDYGRLHEESDVYFMAMELVEGSSLHQVLKK